MPHQALNYDYNGATYSIAADTLSATALEYLVEYGWKQSMGDSIAGRAKKAAEVEVLRLAKLDFPGVDKFSDDQLNEIKARHASDIEASVKTELDAILTKRRDAIQAGSIQAGGGGQRDPWGTLCWNIAAEMVVAAVKKKTGKGPKKDDQFDLLVEQVLVKHADKVEKEATRRQKVSTTLDIDI